MTYPTTQLDRAVARAIDERNRKDLADEALLAQARELGDLYRRVFEAQDRGFVQREGETLTAFVRRANVMLDKQGEVEPFDIAADWEERS